MTTDVFMRLMPLVLVSCMYLLNRMARRSNTAWLDANFTAAFIMLVLLSVAFAMNIALLFMGRA